MKEEDSMIEINQGWCKGCYICIEVCPQEVLGKSNIISDKGFFQVSVINVESCKGCRECEYFCPDHAIKIAKRK